MAESSYAFHSELLTVSEPRLFPPWLAARFADEAAMRDAALMPLVSSRAILLKNLLTELPRERGGFTITLRPCITGGEGEGERREGGTDEREKRDAAEGDAGRRSNAQAESTEGHSRQPIRSVRLARSTHGATLSRCSRSGRHLIVAQSLHHNFLCRALSSPLPPLVQCRHTTHADSAADRGTVVQGAMPRTIRIAPITARRISVITANTPRDATQTRVEPK